MDFAEYFNGRNLKKSSNKGIHYEQKTTPDLLWCVAHVILDITKNDRSRVFSDNDIRESDIFNSLMRDYFSKPPQDKAENEYNKVSSYQLGLFAFSGIIQQVEERPKKYKIVNLPILEQIAINDLNASKFLTDYTEKFLKDNRLLDFFNTYKNKPTQENYLKVKTAYWIWAKKNTAVRGNDPTHSYRVLNKIFNVFCYKNRIPGEDSSNVSTGPCPYAFLIYNRTNFRDENMPSGMTRQQYKTEVLSGIEREGVVETLLQKAKDSIKEKYNNDSEIKDSALGYIANGGVHVHHILSRYYYPQFSLSKENLIALTPGQHLSSAHPQSNTKITDPKFQIVCLKKKFEHIKASLELGEKFYDLKEFIKILNNLFNWSLKEGSTIGEVKTSLDNI